MAVMRIESRDMRRTLIAIVMDYVNRWRKANGWSRETVSHVIVEAHQKTGGEEITGIVFDHSRQDAFTRHKNAADRIFRWLDDSTKDSNLLPANFLLSILAAMPMDMRVACLNDLLRSICVTVRPFVACQDRFDAADMLRRVIKDQSEAEMALVDLVDGATYEELTKASKELSDVIVVVTDVQRRIETAIRRRNEKDSQ